MSSLVFAVLILKKDSSQYPSELFCFKFLGSERITTIIYMFTEV